MSVELEKKLRAAKAHFRREYPHADERWTIAEDKRLRKLVRKYVEQVSELRFYVRWQKVGREMGRPPLGCSQRWTLLRTVDKYVKLDRKKRRK